MGGSEQLQGVLGVILAGGRSLRMGGGDKCLRHLGGRPILEWVIERVRPQVPDLIINANGDPERFAPFHLPVVADVIGGFAGPLAGILTAMEWAASHRPSSRWVASFSGDCPFLPKDLVMRMLRAVEVGNGELACVSSSGRTHPVCGLWGVELADRLRKGIVEDGIRKTDLWTAQRRVVQVAFSSEPMDPFFNVNSPEDLVAAEGHAARDPFDRHSDQ
jgi:molybdopterin-guanine dinucleotide biosynthesis protein A